MTRDAALDLSAKLDDAEISHTIRASIIEKMHPPKSYTISVIFHELTGDKVRELETIIEPFGLDMHFGVLSHEISLWEKRPAVIA